MSFLSRIYYKIFDRRVGQIATLPWERGREAYTPFDFRIFVEMYKNWVYICSTRNADAVAEVPIKLYYSKTKRSNPEGEKLLFQTKAVSSEEKTRLKSISGLYPYISKALNVEEVVEHPILDLLRTVNPTLNRYDLWFLTQLFIELTGNAYWYIVKNRLKTPFQIWVVPAQYMKVAISENGDIAGYVYLQSGEKVPFDRDEIIHFKIPSPTSLIYGQGPLSAITDAVLSDTSIRVFESTLMKNMGRPEAVLETDQLLDAITYRRIKADWEKEHGGDKKVGKTIILGKGLKYKPITMTARDTGYIQSRKINKEEIAAAYGIPLSKIQTENVNRANALAGERQWRKDTIEPRIRRMEEKLNEAFIPMFDSNLFLAYDSAVPADMEQAMKIRASNLQNALTSVNEEREKLNMEEVEWGKVPIMFHTRSRSLPTSFDNEPDEVIDDEEDTGEIEEDMKPEGK